MIVYIQNQQNDLPINETIITKIAQEVVRHEGHQFHEVSLSFVTDQEMQNLHLEHFNDPTSTDCISFPMDLETDDDYKVLGDVIMCPTTALNYSKTHQTDPFEELILYLVHGLLHLMGYDDIEENDQVLMREAEKRHMLNLKKLDFCSHS